MAEFDLSPFRVITRLSVEQPEEFVVWEIHYTTNLTITKSGQYNDRVQAATAAQTWIDDEWSALVQSWMNQYHILMGMTDPRAGTQRHDFDPPSYERTIIYRAECKEQFVQAADWTPPDIRNINNYHNGTYYEPPVVGAAFQMPEPDTYDIYQYADGSRFYFETEILSVHQVSA